MIQNRWNETEAARCSTLLEQRVYSSRLLGADPTLVMHGGGNTSVKDEVSDILGKREPVLYIKGSGWDLATIEAKGFPAVKMSRLLALRELESLSDPAMVNELRTSLMDSTSPDPSVEALLHAFLPHRFVDHSHSEAILTLSNQPDGEAILKKLYGDRVGIVPYVMPGFQLAKLCAEVFEKSPRVEGLILLKHGVFSFGDTAKQSYERMIALVKQAEEYIAGHARKNEATPTRRDPKLTANWLLGIRRHLGKRGFTANLLVSDDDVANSLADHPKVGSITQRGPITPDHIIRTKQVPLVSPTSAFSDEMLATELDRYTARYNEYFKRNCQLRKVEKTMLDTLPRVFVIPGVGVITAGKTTKDARIAMDLYEQTARVILTAESLGGYEALPEVDLFDVEYWVLEQAKLKLSPKKLPLTGKVALVTGGASGIGLATVKELLSQGANVVALDLNDSAIESAKTETKKLCAGGNTVTFHKADVTSKDQMAEAFRQTVLSNGGVDAIVVNAGIFPASNLLENIPMDQWEKSLTVNLSGAFVTVAESLACLKAQGLGGDIIFIASKNVPAPGKEAGAYSIAKAGQTQLARVAALEAGAHGVRVNVLHPHLIFDTGIWTDEVVRARAKSYGLTPEQYRTNNLLKKELSSVDVARAVFALLTYFPKTTGAQIPVDGGSDRTL